MKINIFTTFIFIFFSINVLGQTNYTISGYVQEDESGENLIGVSIYDKETLKGTVTNQYGFYSLTLEEGTYNITYSFIGLESLAKEIILNKNTRINVSLQNNTIKSKWIVLHCSETKMTLQ